MDKNLYSQLVKAAYEAYARFDAAELKATAAAAKAAASQEAMNTAIENGLRNWFEVNPRTKMFLLLVIPFRVAKKGGLYDYGVLRHYIKESLRHFGASKRDMEILLHRKYVMEVRALSKKVPVAIRKEEPSYIWLMTEAPLVELLKSSK